MRTSETTGKLVEALARAQGAITPPVKSKTAKAGSFSYSYADLAEVFDAIRKPFADNGLVIVQTIDADDSGQVLVTRLAHVSGEWYEGVYRLPGNLSGQQLGSAITYARRYSVCSIAWVAAEDDDDGAAAEKVGPKLPPKPDLLLSSLKTMAKEAATSGKLTEFRESAEVKAQAGMLSPAHLAEFKQAIKDLDGLAK